MATGAVIATAVIGAGTAIHSYEERRSAQRQEEKARDASQARAQVDNARQRRRAIAQQRIASARNEVQQAGSEVASSSALSGVQSSLTSQLGSNIAAQQGQVATQRLIGNRMQNAADARGRAALGQAIGKVGTSFANAYNWEGQLS